MLYVDPASHSFALRSAETIGGPAREAAVLQEFEQVFINLLLKEMRKTVPDGGLFEKSQQQQYFQEIFDDHLAGEMARSGQFGIARQMQEQLARTEESRKSGAMRESAGGLPLTVAPEGLPFKASGSGYALPEKEKGLPLSFGPEALPLAPIKVVANQADKQAVVGVRDAARRPRSNP